MNLIPLKTAKNHILLRAAGVVDAEVAKDGTIANPAPDFDEDLVAFGGAAQALRILGIGDGLVIDFEDDIALAQAGHGGIGSVINIGDDGADDVQSRAELAAEAGVQVLHKDTIERIGLGAGRGRGCSDGWKRA